VRHGTQGPLPVRSGSKKQKVQKSQRGELQEVQKGVSKEKKCPKLVRTRPRAKQGKGNAKGHFSKNLSWGEAKAKGNPKKGRTVRRRGGARKLPPGFGGGGLRKGEVMSPSKKKSAIQNLRSEKNQKTTLIAPRNRVFEVREGRVGPWAIPKAAPEPHGKGENQGYESRHETVKGHQGLFCKLSGKLGGKTFQHEQGMWGKTRKFLNVVPPT